MSGAKAEWSPPETLGDGIQRLLELARRAGADVSGYDSTDTPERRSSEDWTGESGYAWSKRMHDTRGDRARPCLSFLASAGHSFGIYLDRLRRESGETRWVTQSGFSWSFMDLISPSARHLAEFEESLQAAEDAAELLDLAPAVRRAS